MANPFKRLLTQGSKAAAREADEVLQGLPSTVLRPAAKAADVVEDAILVEPQAYRPLLDRLLNRKTATALGLGASGLALSQLGDEESPPEREPAQAEVLPEQVPEVPQAPAKEEESEQIKVLRRQLSALKPTQSAQPMVVEGESLGTAENLQNAQQAKRDAQLMARLGRSGELLGAAISGAKPTAQEVFKDLEQSAESIETDFTDLVKNERNDPNSAYSKGLKEYLKRAGLNVQGDLSGEAAEKLMPYAVRQYEADLERETKKQMLEMRMAEAKDLAKEKQATRVADKAEKVSKLADKQVQAIDAFDSSIADMSDIMRAAEANFTGPIDAKIPDLLVSGDEAAFRAKVGRAVDTYRKLITGAAAGDKELRRIESRLPNTSDTYTNFKAKAKDFLSTMQKARTRYLGNLEKSGKSVEAFRETSAPVKSENSQQTIGMDAKKKARLEELRKKRDAGTLE